MMTLPMDAGAEKCPATLRNPACVRPVHGMANKVEVLGLAARRQGLSSAKRACLVIAACGLRVIFNDLNIWSRIEWSKTTRGGKQLDLLGNDEPEVCKSSYGLCE